VRSHDFILIATLTWAAAVATSAKADPRDPTCVAVLSTNDIHGNVEPHVVEAGGQKLRAGGLLAIASYIDVLREQYGDRVLLLDGGDLYQGTLTSNLSEGQAIVAAMSSVGYDAAAVGNHEFDFGAGAGWEPAKPGDEPLPDERLRVIKNRIEEARFPFLAINIYDKATHRPVKWRNLKSSMLVDKGGITIGVIGAATPDTPRVTRPYNVVSLDFVPPAPLVIAEARQLRARGAKLVVFVAHMGGVCNNIKDPNDASSCDPDQEMFQLLQDLPDGTLDVAVGGHTHNYIRHWLHGTATIEASARGRAIGWVEACMLPTGGIDRARSTIHSPIDPCLDEWKDGGCKPRKSGTEVVQATFFNTPMTVHPGLEKLLEPYVEQAGAQARRPLGITLPAPILRELPDGKSPLGDIVCDAMRQSTGAPIAVQNRGGIRTDLAAGELTFQQVFEMLPFDNRVAVMRLRGSELIGFIGLLTERRQGVVPLVRGVLVTSVGGKAQVTLASGAPIVADQHYVVATNDFLALGGEGLHVVFKDVPKEHVTVLDSDLREALIAYLRLHPPSSLSQDP
jgi:5'-nucleotidase